MTAAPKDLASSLTKLSLHPTPSKSASAFASKQKPAPVADAWDEESSDTETEDNPSTHPPLSPQSSASYPSAPPPTPISPKAHQSFISPYGYGERMGERGKDEDRRPEKTDAVAKRMIAGALGVRAPKKTEEQKAYERAGREKEVKRREREREMAVREKEEAERAKAAVWED